MVHDPLDNGLVYIGGVCGKVRLFIPQPVTPNRKDVHDVGTMEQCGLAIIIIERTAVGCARLCQANDGYLGMQHETISLNPGRNALYFLSNGHTQFHCDGIVYEK